MAATKIVENKQFQIKGRKFDETTGIFEGYASIFGNLDTDGDIVDRGAYAKCLATGWDRVKILALHNDQWLPIGKPLELYEDDIGLYIKAKISDTSMGLDIRQLLKDGVLDELSIGYIVLDCFIDSDSSRHLTELELQEVSIVTWAANEQAKILSVKARDRKSAAESTQLLHIAQLLEDQAASLRLLAQGDKPKAEPSATNSEACKHTLPATLFSQKSKHKI